MPENQSFSSSKQGEKNIDFLDINDNGHTEKGDKTLCLNSAKIIFNSIFLSNICSLEHLIHLVYKLQEY